MEREEGVFDFGWLDRIFERIAEHAHTVILANPSGAKPAWMSRKYPEIRRVNAAGLLEPHWHRHNHCWSSPVYREKVGAINTQLATRYGRHPALAMWHVSNELGNDSLSVDWLRFRNRQGEAWYVGPRLDAGALGAFYRPLARRLGLEKAWDGELPQGISAQRRLGDGEDYVFLENFTPCSQTIALGGRRVRDLLTGGMLSDALILPSAGSTVLAVPSSY